MNRIIQLVVLLVALLPGPRLLAGEPSCCDSRDCFSFGQLAPAGGWNPGGGILHWWRKCCFPNCGTCDDYCRKPLPCFCWPDYSRYYTFGPSEICYGQCGCGAAGGKGCLAPAINACKR
jgi:hypothetical protein